MFARHLDFLDAELVGPRRGSLARSSRAADVMMSFPRRGRREARARPRRPTATYLCGLARSESTRAPLISARLADRRRPMRTLEVASPRRCSAAASHWLVRVAYGHSTRCRICSEPIAIKPLTLPPPIGRAERLARLAKARALMQRHGIGAMLVESGAEPRLFHRRPMVAQRAADRRRSSRPAATRSSSRPFSKGRRSRKASASRPKSAPGRRMKSRCKLVADFLASASVARSADRL